MPNAQLLDRVKSLRASERRVLSLLTFGYPNKQIAVALGLSEATVKSYISSIFVALQCSNRTQAALVGFCLRNRLNVDGIIGRARTCATIKHFMHEFENEIRVFGSGSQLGREAPAPGREAVD